MANDRLRHPLVAVAVALALTIPWIVTFVAHGGYGTVHPGENIAPVLAVLVAGGAVLGASFMLAWGAETAEKDVPRAFAIAVLAVLAVAPEYAVDALYAWQAGAGGATAESCAQLTAHRIATAEGGLAAACHSANLAVANMTGANRILIGLGWSGIALFTVYRSGSDDDHTVENKEGFLASRVHLDRDIGLEIVFLLVATAFAFFVPLLGGIGIMDTIALVGVYAAYITIIVRGDVEEEQEQVGVPAYLQKRPFPVRATASIALFVFSGVMIFTAVHPFAKGLEVLGGNYGIPDFFMIQWIAPLASESPELIVVAYLVNKARSTAGFNALISSKLNQWTLLIGTLAVVYSIAFGQIGTLPFDEKQTAEIWITAAQSLFAIAIITNFEISVREAVVLLVLFVTQVAAEYVVILTTTSGVRETELSILILYAYTVVYMVGAVGLFWRRRDHLRNIVRHSATTARNALVSGTTPAEGAD